MKNEISKSVSELGVKIHSIQRALIGSNNKSIIYHVRFIYKSEFYKVDVLDLKNATDVIKATIKGVK